MKKIEYLRKYYFNIGRIPAWGQWEVFTGLVLSFLASLIWLLLIFG